MGLVHNHARHRQGQPKLQGAIGPIAVQPNRMPGAFECVNQGNLGGGCVKILRPVQGEDRAEFFARKRMPLADAVFLHQQHGGRQRGQAGQAGTAGNQPGSLPYHGGREFALGPHQGFEPSFFCGVKQHRALRTQRLQHGRINSVHDHQTVFRGATGGVVKGLGAQHALSGRLQVCAFVDDARHIACAHAKGRGAAGIGRPHIGL